MEFSRQMALIAVATG